MGRGLTGIEAGKSTCGKGNSFYLFWRCIFKGGHPLCCMESCEGKKVAEAEEYSWLSAGAHRKLSDDVILLLIA